MLGRARITLKGEFRPAFYEEDEKVPDCEIIARYLKDSGSTALADVKIVFSTTTPDDINADFDYLVVDIEDTKEYYQTPEAWKECVTKIANKIVGQLAPKNDDYDISFDA